LTFSKIEGTDNKISIKKIVPIKPPKGKYFKKSFVAEAIFTSNIIIINKNKRITKDTKRITLSQTRLGFRPYRQGRRAQRDYFDHLRLTQRLRVRIGYYFHC
jgi:predicted ribosome quality control (RQC) complex YloA/Tae2 family protein